MSGAKHLMTAPLAAPIGVPWFVACVSHATNESVEQVAAYVMTQPPRAQAQFVERLLAIASAVASHQAGQR